MWSDNAYENWLEIKVATEFATVDSGMVLLRLGEQRIHDAVDHHFCRLHSTGGLSIGRRRNAGGSRVGLDDLDIDVDWGHPVTDPGRVCGRTREQTNVAGRFRFWRRRLLYRHWH